MEIHILRLGHRLPRDERISTHVALVARAFGAGAVIYSGQHDSGLEDSVRSICEKWGGKTGNGSFSVSYQKNALSVIRDYKNNGFAVVHLTMYGLPVQSVAAELQKRKKLLIVVGSEHVPGEVYRLADYNVAVTNQPHSEVAALALVLDRIFQGKELEREDFGGRLSILPSENSKKFREV